MNPGDDIRWIFGGFILAFVIAEIAKELGTTLLRSGRAERGVRLSHLAYTLAVVVMSWWGWSMAVSGGNVYVDYPESRSLFKYTNWLFLIDIGIFMTYYVLLAGIENPGAQSARHALKCTVAIFAGYLLWDLAVAVKPVDPAKLLDPTIAWKHAYASAACVALTLAGLYSLRKPAGDRATYCIYAALFLLMLGFRLTTASIHADASAVRWFLGAAIACGASTVVLALLAGTRKPARR